MCCSRELWDTELARNDVDYLEEREDGWAASVSVILTLLSTRSGARDHMHDETGSGQAEKQGSNEAALAQAEFRAVESARRRLAKRFAPSINSRTMASIEMQCKKRRVM